jgi:hypothetical protein
MWLNSNWRFSSINMNIDYIVVKDYVFLMLFIYRKFKQYYKDCHNIILEKRRQRKIFKTFLLDFNI